MVRTIGSFDDLSAAVREDIRHKRESRKEEALSRAREIRDEARQEADRVQAEILEEAQVRAEERRRQRLADAAQEAQRMRLEAREALIDEVWERAEEELRDLVERDDYVEVLRQLALQAVRTLGSGHLVLAADPEGHGLLTEDRLAAWGEEASRDVDAAVEFRRADDPLDAWGGLIASKNRGRKRLDARFSVRLEIARSEIRDEVFNHLMGES